MSKSKTSMYSHGRAAVNAAFDGTTKAITATSRLCNAADWEARIVEKRSQHKFEKFELKHQRKVAAWKKKQGKPTSSKSSDKPTGVPAESSTNAED